MRAFLLAILGFVGASETILHAQESLTLRETFPPGYCYSVGCRVQLSGKLQVPVEKGKPPKTVEMVGQGIIDYDERILPPDTNADHRTLRIYRKIDFRRTIDGREQEATLRPEVRRLVILRAATQEVPFSPDGPLQWGEIDTVRTDVFTPILVGLLPKGAVRVGDSWIAETSAAQELTDMEHVEAGKLECRLDEITTLSGRRHARIGFRGSLRGVNEDGPNEQELNGSLYFDLESKHISYLTLRGRHHLLDKDGKTNGTIEGTFTLTRRAHVAIPELSDNIVSSLTISPNSENTLLLYDNPDLGLRLTHPRRWRVNAVQGKQVTLAEDSGGGILLTVEPPNKVPTPEQFLQETETFLRQSKAKIAKVDHPQQIGISPRRDRFFIEAEVVNQRVHLEYVIQRQTEGGVVIAIRLPIEEKANLGPDLVKIVTSVRLTKAITP